MVEIICCEVEVKGRVFLQDGAHFRGDGVCLYVSCQVGVWDGVQ